VTLQDILNVLDTRLRRLERQERISALRTKVAQALKETPEGEVPPAHLCVEVEGLLHECGVTLVSAFEAHGWTGHAFAEPLTQDAIDALCAALEA
jgi:hypothetical protein